MGTGTFPTTGAERAPETGALTSLGPVLLARRAGRHVFDGPCERKMSWSWLLATLGTFVVVVILVGTFGFPRLPGGVIWLVVALGPGPMLAGVLLTGLPKYEFRERGVRYWRWLRGWCEVPVDADTAVTYRFGHPDGYGYACRLILGADPKDPGTFLLRSFRKRDWPRLLEVAIHYSRPRAERMLDDLRAGRGAYWMPRFRLDPEGLRYRAGGGEARALLEYGDLRSIETEGAVFRIVGADGTRIEGDAYHVNILAGRLVLEAHRPPE